jgi:hypothetical protein
MGPCDPADEDVPDEITTTRVFFEPLAESGITLNRESLHSAEFDAACVPAAAPIDTSVLIEITEAPCPECGMLLDLRAVPFERPSKDRILRRNTPVMVRSLVCPDCGWTGRETRLS